MTPDHTIIQVRSLGNVESELVGLPGKALAQEDSGSLSMQPVGYTPWCSTDVCWSVQSFKAIFLAGNVERIYI